MKTGIVLCSRSDSERVYRKPFQILNGVPLIEHLVDRLLTTGLEVFLAVPERQEGDYVYLTEKFKDHVHLLVGEGEDPLARMFTVAEFYNLDAVVRVCHDKVFVDPDLLELAVGHFRNEQADYLYSTEFTEGSGFEVISFSALRKAHELFKKVEHVSYAVRAVADHQIHFDVPAAYRSRHRLLVDYPEDLGLLQVILSVLGNACTLKEAIAFLDRNPWAGRMNQLPLVSIYTCAHDAEAWIERCMGSVSKQHWFRNFEYILVDDFSRDDTTYLMAKFAALYGNVKFVRNPSNLGLASSSNVALSHARGRYMLRLDADDWFPTDRAIVEMIQAIESQRGIDAVFPDNYFGSMQQVQSGSDVHHVGGAIFRRSAVNHIKFTEKLRGYDGLDFFERAKGQLNIGYLKKPMFFYTQRPGSLSKTNLEEREKIRKEIHERTNSPESSILH